MRELQSHIVSATLQQLAKDAAELAEDAEVSESGSEEDDAGVTCMWLCVGQNCKYTPYMAVYFAIPCQKYRI